MDFESKPTRRRGTKMTSLIKKSSSFLLLVTTATQVFSFDIHDYLSQGHAVVQLGGYWSKEGKAQHINIDTLIGDDFTISKNDGSNGLFGLGYFVDGQQRGLFNMAYGVNFFYLAPTSVRGTVVQENLFTNLSYAYHVTHYPVYAVAKATLNTPSPAYSFGIDAGIGPNFMHTGNFHEESLDNGITIPDSIFSEHTSTTFSAMAGVGIKLNQIFGQAPLECGYKFFYLGEGSLSKKNDQVVNALKTGSSYANAVMCSITV